jgi:flagellar basal body-associated protein FliL
MFIYSFIIPLDDDGDRLSVIIASVIPLLILIIVISLGIFIYVNYFRKKIKLVEPNFAEVVYQNTLNILNVKASSPEFYADFAKVSFFFIVFFNLF